MAPYYKAPYYNPAKGPVTPFGAAAPGIVCVAWDAGGVATGSVTVPLILATGLGLGRQRQPPAPRSAANPGS